MSVFNPATGTEDHLSSHNPTSTSSPTGTYGRSGLQDLDGDDIDAIEAYEVAEYGNLGPVTISGTPANGSVILASSATAAAWANAPWEYPILFNGTAYPARPVAGIVPAGQAHYIGPIVPTDSLIGDLWDDTSTALVLPNTSSLWTGSNLTLSSSTSTEHNYVASLEGVTGSAAQSYANCTISIPWSASGVWVSALMWAGASGTVASNRQTQMSLTFQNASYTTLGSTINGSSYPLSASTWTQMNVRGQTPTSVAWIVIALIYDSTNGTNLSSSEDVFFSFT